MIHLGKGEARMKGERKKTRAENLGKRKKRDPYQPFLGNPALLIIHIFPLLQFPLENTILPDIDGEKSLGFKIF